MRTEEPPFVRISAHPAPTSAATLTPAKFRTWLMDLAGEMCSTTHLKTILRWMENCYDCAMLSVRVYIKPGHNHLFYAIASIRLLIC